MRAGAIGAITASRHTSHTRHGGNVNGGTSQNALSEANAQKRWFELPQDVRLKVSKTHASRWDGMTWVQKLETAHSKEEEEDVSANIEAEEVIVEMEAEETQPSPTPHSAPTVVPAIPRIQKVRVACAYGAFILGVLGVMSLILRLASTGCTHAKLCYELSAAIYLCLAVLLSYCQYRAYYVGRGAVDPEVIWHPKRSHPASRLVVPAYYTSWVTQVVLLVVATVIQISKNPCSSFATYTILSWFLSLSVLVAHYAGMHA